MKILIITLGVLALGLGAMQLMALKSQKNIESYPYSVIETMRTLRSGCMNRPFHLRDP